MQAVIFLVDGMRPDGLKEAETPNMDKLMETGAYTLSGRTVMPSSTMPAIVSLFMGVEPEQHKALDVWVPLPRPAPTLIDVYKKADRRTASFYNWEPLRNIALPGSLDISFFTSDLTPLGDQELTEMAIMWLRKCKVDFAFVYLGHTDIAGHDHGWMSEPYLKAISDADMCIGQVLDVLDDERLVVVTSDHGGHGKGHGTDCEEDMTIPVIFNGPGIPVGKEIGRTVEITDVAPTIASLVGLEAPKEWKGRAICF